MAAAALTPIDLEPFLLDPRSPAAQAACDALADTLVATSALVVRDPRVSSAQNDTFLSLLERYYAQPRAATAADERPEVHFQVRAAGARVLARAVHLRRGSIRPHAQAEPPCPTATRRYLRARRYCGALAGGRHARGHGGAAVRRRRSSSHMVRGEARTARARRAPG